MPKLVAIEWDAREARVAIGQPRGRDIILDDAFSVEFPAGASPTDVGQHLSEALSSRNVGRAEALVAVGRANIELRQMSLPQAPEEELPEMVRFQAQRQFTTIGTDWPLDFVPLDSQGGEGVSVLAAAISPETVSQIKQVCQACDLTAKHLVLRPFSAASLLCRHERSARMPARLMVDTLKEDADLTVLVEDRVVLMRTVRLPATNEIAAQTQALIGEIRRTVAAAQNQMQGMRVERAVLCGNGPLQQSLSERITSDLSYQVEIFDPFDEARLSSGLQQSVPQNTGRFAPLIGMLLDEATGTPHALDFLHPRRKPEPPDTRRRNLLVGVTAAVAVFCGAAMLWMSLASKDDQIAKLRRELGSLNEDVQLANERRNDLKAIEGFQDNDITWLDELQNVCLEMPPSEGVLLTRVSLENRPTGGAQIVVDGYARDLSEIDALRQALRGPHGRQVKSAGNLDTPKRSDYRWQFRETVLIPPLSEQAALAVAGKTQESATQDDVQLPADESGTEENQEAPEQESAGQDTVDNQNNDGQENA